MKAINQIQDKVGDAIDTLGGCGYYDEPAILAEKLGNAAQRIAEAIAIGEASFLGFRESVEAAALNAARVAS